MLETMHRESRYKCQLVSDAHFLNQCIASLTFLPMHRANQGNLPIPNIYIYIYIYIYILGVAWYTDVTFGTYLGSGVTVRYDFGTTGKKKEIYYARFLFIYFEQTVVKITIFFPSRCENTKYYYMLYI